MAFFRLVPNLTIMAPKDFKELEDMFEFAISLGKPVVIRYPRGGESKEKFEKHDEIILGEPEIIKDGKDITIIAIGNQVSKAVTLGKRLKQINIDAAIINARFLKPLNEEKIFEIISKTPHVITIEDSTIIGGLFSTIEDIVVRNNIKDIKLKGFAYPDVYVEHGTVNELEKIYGIDEDSIFNYISNEIIV